MKLIGTYLKDGETLEAYRVTEWADPCSDLLWQPVEYIAGSAIITPENMVISLFQHNLVALILQDGTTALIPADVFDPEATGYSRIKESKWSLKPAVFWKNAKEQ